MKLLSAVLALAALCFAADFWQQKKPADWNEKESKRLMTNSPWAKQVTLQMSGGGGAARGAGGGGMPRGGGKGGGGGGMGGGGMGGMGGGGPRVGGTGPGGDEIGAGGPGGAGMGGGEMGGGGMSMPSVTVVWDSAEPVHEARVKLEQKDYAQERARQYYIVSVAGFPIRPQGDPARFKERLQSGASLVRKGKEPITAAEVGFLRAEKGMTVVFMFLRKDALDEADKEVTFQWQMGGMLVKAKFALKDMKFGGKLAL
ncbi:MAG: hypothetical protein HY235_25015 [Acidobacteria bacterium]|nr:hypothetical protein [Acidobacteriota bacterium]